MSKKLDTLEQRLAVQPLDQAAHVAHDNELLNHEEAMLVFNHVTSSLRFLRDLERRVQRREQAEAEKAERQAPVDDAMPFEALGSTHL